jgi:exonuclease SbcC
MKLLSLNLRGATGIRHGLGLDEVFIDFTRFEPGLVALVGPNGSGKTSILENLHPYLQLVSRDGSLSNHFQLRDSYRDLKFELQGHTYRVHILIDAQTARTEAYLYRDGQPLNDGKVNTYKVEIEKLLGSPDLFFRSIFSSQNAESITALTPGKRKELFMELLGLQRYERYAELCKVKIDALENEIAGKRGKLELVYAETSKRTVVEEELSKYEADLSCIEITLQNLQQQITSASEILILNERRIAEDAQKQVQIHDMANEISVLESQQWKMKNDFEREEKKLKDQGREIEAEIERKKKIVEHKAEIESSVMRLKVLRTQLKALEERKSQLVEVEQAESAERLKYQQDENEYTQKVRNIEGKIILADMEIKGLNQNFDREIKDRQRDLLEAQTRSVLVNEVPCSKIDGLPGQCKLLSSAIEAKKSIEIYEDRISELNDPEYRATMGLGDLEKHIDDLRREKQSLIQPIAFSADEFESQKRSIGYDASQYLKTKTEIEDLEKGNWESLIEELRLAESMIEEKQKALQDILGRLTNSLTNHTQALAESVEQSKAKRAKWEELKTSVLTQIDLDSFKKHKLALADTVAAQKQVNNERSNILGDIQFRQEMIKKLDTLKADAEAIESDLTSKLLSLEHHKLLHQACSKDGIPALELDAAGPEVSRIANDLLASTFGSRFQIAFETTKISKDKKKQIETFEIRVYGEEGEKKIEDLSGGQRVWIETALQEAIAIYLSEKSGKELLTSYQDEKDGALDPENKQHFVEMSREAFRLGRRYFTFLITQTPDIWQQVQQRLHLHPESGTIEQIV